MPVTFFYATMERIPNREDTHIDESIFELLAEALESPRLKVRIDRERDQVYIGTDGFWILIGKNFIEAGEGG
jgi:hypothetical protein